MGKDTLPVWERCAYWVIGVFSIAYSWWRMFIEGDALKKKYLRHGLKKNWTFLGRHWDVSDAEWSLWRGKLGLHLGFCCIHIGLSQLCRLLKCSVKTRLFVLVLCDLICLGVIFGPKVIIYMLLKTFLVYVTSCVGGTAGVWTLYAAQVFVDSLLSVKKAQEEFLGVSGSSLSDLFVVANGFLDIRLISFGLDNARLQAAKLENHREIEVSSRKSLGTKEIEGSKKDIQSNDSCTKSLDELALASSSYILEMLLYLFYFPSFIHGPIFLFQKFRLQVRTSFASSDSFPTDLKSILKNLVRITFWMLFMELSLHFLYFGALAYNSSLRHLSVWAVVAVGHATGQFFMVKYLVLYGFGGQLSRFDGAIPYPEPRCVSWVYSYTDMWKYFDTGLYNFIKVYLYVPLGGSKYGLLRQLAASGVVFFFIYTWHGGTYFLFIWCCGNYLVGGLETLACVLERSYFGQRLVSAVGPAMMLRIKCLLFAPAYLASCLQTFYFLFHVDEAWEITERILLKTSWSQFGALMGIFYACIHNAKFLRSKLCEHSKLS